MCSPYLKIRISKRQLFTLVISLMISLGMALGSSAASAQSAASIWDGVYSTAQAQRGAEQYSARCASCHSVDLRGNSNSPSLLGMAFMFLWEGKSLGELYKKMSTEMPTDQPGSLPAQSYRDILAFILQSNQFPAGTNDLAQDEASLNQITIAAQ